MQSDARGEDGLPDPGRRVDDYRSIVCASNAFDKVCFLFARNRTWDGFIETRRGKKASRVCLQNSKHICLGNDRVAFGLRERLASYEFLELSRRINICVGEVRGRVLLQNVALSPIVVLGVL